MSQQDNILIAQRFLANLGTGAEAGVIALMFSEDVQFDIAGDAGALPWIGRGNGRGAASAFIRDTRVLIEQLRFDVVDILASEHRAAVVGELMTRVKATGKIIESAFVLVLTISGGVVTRFQMLEDSFAVSRAARP